MLFKKDEIKHLWPFYLYSLIFGLCFMIMPFMIIYLRDIGFTFFQISILMFSYGLCTLIFEIPTGALADSFSRKYSVLIGFIITGVAAMFIPLFETFYTSIFGWSLAAIGITFTSGAEEAWIIDNLNHLKRKDLHHEYFIKGASISALGMIISPILGSIITKTYPIKILWYFFGLGFFLSAIILGFFAPEHYKPKKENMFHALKKSLINAKERFNFVRNHNTVFLLIFGYVISYLMFMGKEGWTPLLVTLGLQEHSLGYLYAISAFFMMIIPFLSRYFTKFKVKYVVSVTILIQMIFGFMILFVTSKNYVFGLLIFTILNVLPHFNTPLLKTYFHKFVPKKTRATVSSIENMAFQFVGSVFALVAGYLMDLYGPQKVIGWTSLLGVFSIMIYLKIKDEK